MGKYKNGILGTFTGKVGTVVGIEQNGQHIMRAYNGYVRNPRTERQQLHRARFAMVGRMASQFASSIGLGLKVAAVQNGTTACAMFTKLNFSAIEGTLQEGLHVEWGRVALSTGPLGLPAFDAPAWDIDQSIRLGLTIDDATSTPFDRRFDWVVMVAYCPDLEASTYSMACRRCDLVGRLRVPASFLGHRLHLYAFVVGSAADNCGLASPTVYLGALDA